MENNVILFLLSVLFNLIVGGAVLDCYVFFLVLIIKYYFKNKIKLPILYDRINLIIIKINILYILLYNKLIIFI